MLDLYQKAKGGEFCAWDEYYPTIREVQHDLDTDNLYVLTDGRRIIGAISIVPENEMDGFCCWTEKNAREIARVAVDTDYRGNGLSFEMVQNIKPILRRGGYEAIHLSVVKSNIPALKTYIKAGFSIVGEADMYGNSYYLMEKAIN